jgi:uncharacterized membrane protein YedE/YeeE
MSDQILGLITGVLFGILLQQGRVLRFEKQVGAMLFRDMTIFKFMLSAIIVGMIGINGLAAAGIVGYKVKATHVGANLIGGLLFGGGWALMGYCPGTSVGAVGEGRWHAIWGILGMLVGAAIYAELYPVMEISVLTWGSLGKQTLDGLLGVSKWVLIPVLTVAYLLFFVVLEKLKI